MLLVCGACCVLHAAHGTWKFNHYWLVCLLGLRWVGVGAIMRWLAMDAFSTFEWFSIGNQPINDNSVYRLLVRPQKCHVSVKRQMVNGKYAHASKVCNIVWLLAERAGGRGEREERQTDRLEILLIKFAKLFAIKPLSCSTNNVQHATASSTSSSRATNTTISSSTTVRIAISVLFPSLSISLCGVCCPCLSIYCVAALLLPQPQPQHGASAFALRLLLDLSTRV